jgi:hypothetical protein
MMLLRLLIHLVVDNDRLVGWLAGIHGARCSAESYSMSQIS